MSTAPALPPVGARDPAAHRAIALRFLDHAQIELDRGHRLQASEKAWGAVAHELKAIAIERGWNHESHDFYSRMVNYLTKEYGLNEDLRRQVTVADHSGHRNFYENQQTVRDIQRVINEATSAVATVEELRGRKPQPYTIDESDQYDVELLTDWRFEKDHTRMAGFVNLPSPLPPGQTRRRRGEHFNWRTAYPNDPENPKQGGGGQRPPNPPPSPSGGAPATASNGGTAGSSSRTTGPLRSALQKARAKIGLNPGLGSARLRGRRRSAPPSQGEKEAPAGTVDVIY